MQKSVLYESFLEGKQAPENGSPWAAPLESVSNVQASVQKVELNVL